MLKAGDKAPNFALYDHDRNLVKLEDLKGKKVVLLFFPLAFTSTCTAEMCSVRDDIAFYNQLDAEVFGISVDSSFTLKKFREEQGLNFRLLSDFNKEASEAYGSMYDTFGNMSMLGVSKRSAFVIDKDGIIRYAEVLENAGELPNLDAVKETLKSI